MKIESKNLRILFIIIGISLPIIVISKLFYNQYIFNSNVYLRTQLIEKIHKAENVSIENIKIVKIDSYSEEKIGYVVVYYRTENNQQKSKTFRYYQAVFGRINVGKEVK